MFPFPSSYPFLFFSDILGDFHPLKPISFSHIVDVRLSPISFSLPACLSLLFFPCPSLFLQSWCSSPLEAHFLFPPRHVLVAVVFSFRRLIECLRSCLGGALRQYSLTDRKSPPMPRLISYFIHTQGSVCCQIAFCYGRDGHVYQAAEDSPVPLHWGGGWRLWEGPARRMHLK